MYFWRLAGIASNKFFDSNQVRENSLAWYLEQGRNEEPKVRSATMLRLKQANESAPVSSVAKNSHDAASLSKFDGQLLRGDHVKG